MSICVSSGFVVIDVSIVIAIHVSISKQAIHMPIWGVTLMVINVMVTEKVPAHHGEDRSTGRRWFVGVKSLGHPVLFRSPQVHTPSKTKYGKYDAKSDERRGDYCGHETEFDE